MPDGHERVKVCSLRGLSSVYLTSMRIDLRAVALLLALPLLARAGWGQLAPSPDAAPVSNAPAQPTENQSVATFKLEVNLVDLFFSVKNKNGELVPHLTKDDCTVLEDKVPAKAQEFCGRDQSTSDIGHPARHFGSQERVLPLEQQAGCQFLQQVLRQEGRGISAFV